jgi:hypothetical protein
MKYKLVKKYGGGGGNPAPQTVETIPEWARPAIQQAQAEAGNLYASGKLDDVAGATANQKAAFGMGSTIAETGKAGLSTLADQQARLKEMAMTGGAAELQDALKLDVGMSSANLGNQFGAGGMLGSARHALAEKTSEDAAKAKYASEVIKNKAAAETALGTSVGQGVSTAGSTTSNLAKIGSEERGIEQQIADAPYQALQRYATTVYGNPARQQAVQQGGK